MALTSDNVRVAVTGAVYVGETDATAPTDTATALDNTWTDLGYLSADGIAEAMDRTTQQIRAWQDGSLVREVVTEGSYTLTMTFIETNQDVLELYYGATVTTGVMAANATTTGGRKAFVVDVIDGASIERIYLPNAEVTSVGERTLASGEAVGYEVTISAYTDNGVTFQKFFSDLGA